MKEERVIELERNEVATILAKHFGVEYREPGYYALDQNTYIGCEIYWEGNDKKDKHLVKVEKKE